MNFESGLHAMSWYMNESGLLSSPGCITGSILNMMKSGTSGGGGGGSVSEDDKHNAKIDLENMISKMEKREVSLIERVISNGNRDAIKHIRTSPEWSDWRKKHERGIANNTILHSECMYNVIDKWESLLFEGGYISFCTNTYK